jgi:hypothetical protein
MTAIKAPAVPPGDDAIVIVPGQSSALSDIVDTASAASARAR